jgi:repressor LexA
MALQIERMKNLRKQKGMKQADLAEALHLARSTIAMWEAGKSEPSGDMYAALSRVLDCTVGYLLGTEDEPKPAEEERTVPAGLRPISTLHRQRVPLIGKVAAGQPIMAETDYETFVDSPVDCDCALEIEGESMVPTYMPGDIVYIKHQPTVRDGQVAVVLVDDSATLKHVYRDPDGLTLISDNPDYDRIVVKGIDHDYIAIYGVPVGYTRMFKPDPLKKLKKGMR